MTIVPNMAPDTRTHHKLKCVAATNPSVWFRSESAKGMYLLATCKEKKKKDPEIEEFSN